MAIQENSKVYTYYDYLSLPNNEVLEIINGKIFSMSPAPSRVHQELIMEIAAEIRNYIKFNNCKCKVYPAPFDVVLINDDESEYDSKNIVQPDISVICDKNKLNDKGCFGSPDMIVEIVSKFNPGNDYVKKLYLYEKYKVKEYWIVNPMKKNILVYTLSENGYNEPDLYTFKDKVSVGIFKNLEIDFNSII